MWFQVRELDPAQRRVTVFGDWPGQATVRAFRGEWALARDELLKDRSGPAGRSPVRDLLLSLAYDALDRDDLAAMAYERAVGRDTLAGAAVDVLELAIQVVGRRVARHPDDARLRVHRARWMIRCDRRAERRIELEMADRLAPDRWVEWAGDFQRLLQARAEDAAPGWRLAGFDPGPLEAPDHPAGQAGRAVALIPGPGRVARPR